MSRYTLKTFYGREQLERFEHRDPYKIQRILEHPRFNLAGQTGPWGEELKNPNRFEILDSQNMKIFEGNLDETFSKLKTLR